MKNCLDEIALITESGKVLSAESKKKIEQIKVLAKELEYHPAAQKLMGMLDEMLMSGEIQEVIKKENDKWILYSADGSKKLGEFSSEEDAKDREKQINFFKHNKEAKEGNDETDDEEDLEEHFQGKHSQKTHGRRKSGNVTVGSATPITSPDLTSPPTLAAVTAKELANKTKPKVIDTKKVWVPKTVPKLWNQWKSLYLNVASAGAFASVAMAGLGVLADATSKIPLAGAFLLASVRETETSEDTYKTIITRIENFLTRMLIPVEAENWTEAEVIKEEFEDYLTMIKEEYNLESTEAVFENEETHEAAEEVLETASEVVENSTTTSAVVEDSITEASPKVASVIVASQIIEAVAGAQGREWDVILIEKGLSLNGNYYPDSTLKTSIPLFEGAYAYADHATVADRISRPERSVKDKVGRFKSIEYGSFLVGGHTVEGLKARFKVIAPWLREVLKEAVEAGEPDFLGFSIDAEGHVGKRPFDGKSVNWVEQITTVHSVDVVTSPAAGGRILRLVASTGAATDIEVLSEPELNTEVSNSEPDSVVENTESATENTKQNGGFDMDPEELKRLVDASIQEALISAKPVDETAEIKEQLKLLQETARLRDCEVSIEKALREATGLSDMGKDKIRTQFADLSKRRSWEDTELAAVIKEAIDYEAALVQKFHNPVSPVATYKVGNASKDQMYKALEGLFEAQDIDGVTRFKSLKEGYCRWTGSDPFEVGPFEMARAYSTKYDSAYDSKRVQESLQTSDWASVFANVMYNKMMKAYSYDPYNVWKKFVSQIEDVPDFKTRQWTRIGGYGDLSTVAEQATYPQLTSPGDENVTYSITKYGGLDDVTWEAIINDQVARIRQIPIAMGRAAARTLNKFVMNLVTVANPTMDYDGTALYIAGHGNTGTNVLSLGGVNSSIIAMRDQTAFGETNEILGERNLPRFAVVPNELEARAKRVFSPTKYNAMVLDTNAAAADDGTGVDPEAFADKGIEIVVYDTLSDANDWYFVGDPSKVETLVMGFLNGKQEPDLFVQDQPTVGSVFTADKISYKIRHVFGGEVLDHRSFYRNVIG